MLFIKSTDLHSERSMPSRQRRKLLCGSCLDGIECHAVRLFYRLLTLKYRQWMYGKEKCPIFINIYSPPSCQDLIQHRVNKQYPIFRSFCLIKQQCTLSLVSACSMLRQRPRSNEGLHIISLPAALRFPQLVTECIGFVLSSEISLLIM